MALLEELTNLINLALLWGPTGLFWPGELVWPPV